MKKSNEDPIKIWTLVFSGITAIILLFTFIITLKYYQGGYDVPVIVPVVQTGTNNVCPSQFANAYAHFTTFSLTFKNPTKENTNVWVNVFSKNLSFEKNEIRWFVEGGQTQTFYFKIYENESLVRSLTNFTIYYDVFYGEGQYQLSKQSCSYNRSMGPLGELTSFVLIQNE